MLCGFSCSCSLKLLRSNKGWMRTISTCLFSSIHIIKCSRRTACHYYCSYRGRLGHSTHQPANQPHEMKTPYVIILRRYAAWVGNRLIYLLTVLQYWNANVLCCLCAGSSSDSRTRTCTSNTAWDVQIYTCVRQADRKIDR